MALMNADKLSYEIFSILESKFLFSGSPAIAGVSGCRVRILSIDGGDRPSDALLAAAALARLESSLRARTGDPSARVADLFDVAAGSGAGGVLAAMLFTKGPDGRPLLSAAKALRLLAAESCRRRGGGFGTSGILRRRPGGFFRRVLGDATLRDTVKPVLIPCYDLVTVAPFLFSRADAVEADGFDFRVWEVCAATCAGSSTMELRSVDGRTRVSAVGGRIAMANPTAAAITHVLLNKQEFPFACGAEDLLVVSLGAAPAEPSAIDGAELLRITGECVADMVDQTVAMAFGNLRTSNYIRIQANGFTSGNCLSKSNNLLQSVEDLLLQRNMESFLFRGKKISQHSHADKLDQIVVELIEEEEKRKKSSIPLVAIKQQAGMTSQMSPPCPFSQTVGRSCSSSSTKMKLSEPST